MLNELRQCKAQRQLVWLDACQEREQQEDDRIKQNPTGQLLAALELQAEQSQDFYAMLSCNKTERSWEIPELKHGLFTYSMIEGLGGKAANTEGKIDADSLFKYVERNSKKFIEYKKNPLNIDSFSKGMLGSLKESSTQLKVKRLPVDASQTPQIIARGSGELIIGSAKSSTQRKALIVDELSNSEADISLCRILQAKGSFAVDYCFLREKQRRNLQQTIASYLQSESNQIVLLYLAGTIVSTNSETYELVCDGDNSINLNLLGQQLHDSPVKEIVIIADILDTSGTNKNLVEILQPSQDKSLCLITTTTSSANNRKLLHQLVTVLETAGELEGEFWVSELITQLQKWRDSQPDINLKFWLSGSTEVMDILSVEVQRSHDEIFDIDVCPYKSLEAFTQDDAYFFHGREELIAEIIEKLQSTSFLTVVGASGSGKSSVVKAGVIPQLLKEGLFDFESEQFQSCQSWVMLPGDNPLAALAKSLAPNNPDFLEGVLHLGVDSLVEWLRQQPQEISVLVIDQFEELFTPKLEKDNVNFLNLVLGAIQEVGDFFKVIITLRSDFLDECLGMKELAPLITKSQVLVPSCRLEDRQYYQIIAKPAQKVGLEVEDGLIALLLEELKEGSLPLLQYALEELWHKRKPGKFTVKDYQQYIGKLGKFISNKAQETYNNLNEAQQKCAESIFLSLVFLVKEQEDSNKDTRRRLPISDLLVDKYKNVLDSTLQALINARLIVVSGEENNLSLVNKKQLNNDNEQINDLAEVDGENMNNKSKDKVTVEIAHEILLRDWETLKWWLDENREKYRLIREINQKADDWKQNGKRDGFLLSKGALAKYEEFYVNYADELSRISNDFIDVSIQARDKAEKLAKRRQRQIIGGLTGGIVAISMVAGAALWQLRRATINEINALSNSAEALLESNQELDALVTGLKAGKKIKNSLFRVDNKTRIKLVGRLQNIFDKVKEFNRLEGDTKQFEDIVFSADRQTFFSINEDGIVKQWNWQGKLLNSINKFPYKSHSLTFSSDNKIIVFIPKNNTIELWNWQGKLVKTFDNYDDLYGIGKLQLSPDGKTIAFISQDKTIKLWNIKEQILHTIKGNTDINEIIFSPDGKTITFISKDKTIKLWNIKEQILHTLKAHTDIINEIIFSPDSQTFASVSWDKKIKLWNLKRELLQTFEDHTNRIESLTFSPNSQTIASLDASGILIVWNTIQGKSLYSLNYVDQLTFSPNSKTFAYVSLGRIITLRNWEGQLIGTFDVDKGLLSKLEFSPDSRKLAFVHGFSGEKTVKLWNLQEKSPQTIHSYVDGGGRHSVHLEFSPDSQTIASTSQNNTIKLWDLKGELVQVLNGHTDSIDILKFSPDGQTIASYGKDKAVKLWNIQKKLLQTIEAQADNSESIIFISSGKAIVSISDDKTIKLWNWQGEVLNSLKGIVNNSNKIKFSPNGQIFASYGEAKIAKLWNLQGQLLQTFQDIINVVFSPDGQTVALLYDYDEGEETTIKLWNLEGQLFPSLKSRTGFVRFVEFSPDSQIIASAYHRTVKLWNKQGELLYSVENSGSLKFSPDSQVVASIGVDGTKALKLWNPQGKLLHSFGENTHNQQSVKFSPDSQVFVFASYDDTIKVWNMQEKSLHSTEINIDNISAIKFSPDNQFFASIILDNTLRMWDIKANLLYSISNISDVVFSPDRQIFASISNDNTFKLWDIKGDLLQTFKGHTGSIKNVVFSPDGQTIASASNNNIVKLWSLDLDKVMARGCDWVGDYLTNNPNVSEEDRKICDGINIK